MAWYMQVPRCLEFAAAKAKLRGMCGKLQMLVRLGRGQAAAGGGVGRLEQGHAVHGPLVPTRFQQLDASAGLKGKDSPPTPPRASSTSNPSIPTTRALSPTLHTHTLTGRRPAGRRLRPATRCAGLACLRRRLRLCVGSLDLSVVRRFRPAALRGGAGAAAAPRRPLIPQRNERSGGAAGRSQVGAGG
jgi:hypothetical protein